MVSLDIISVSLGFVFGVVLGIFLFGMNFYVIILVLLFGILSVIIIYSLLKVRGESFVFFLIFFGMVIIVFFLVLILFVKYIVDFYDKLFVIIYWFMGSFFSFFYNNIKIVVFLIIIGIMILYFLRWRINILLFGDEEVKVLGMNLVYIRGFIIVVVIMISVICVILIGIIGWVGLLIFYICCMYIGVDNIKLILSFCIMGVVFMLIIDGIVRIVIFSEIFIGILIFLVGVLFFIIIFKKYRSW